MNRSEGFFRAYQNQELFYQTWKSKDSQSDSIIIITHGMGEHSESYQHFCAGMLPGPYDVYAWDLRGHGRSEGKRGVAGLGEYVEDLSRFVKFVKSTQPQKKLFLLSHSMGGLIQMEYLLANPNQEFSGIIFSSPLMGIAVEVPAVKDMAAKLLVKLMPNITMGNEIANEELTHDESIVASYEKDPLRHNQVCPRLYLDFLEAFKSIKNQAHKFNYPVIMQLAGDDKIVSRPDSEKIFALLGSEDKTKIVYDRMYHEIYNEVDRDKVFGDLKKWIEKRS